MAYPDEMAEVLEELSPEEKHRFLRANEVYSQLFRRNGLRAFSWSSHSAWKEYVDGAISDVELNDKAGTEISHMSQMFGKYLVMEDSESLSTSKDPVKRARAKLANKIYRKICEEKNIDVCFFNSFSVWSDFVKGVIGESEFYRKAEEEVESILSKPR